MKHPAIDELALFVSQDLGWWRNAIVRRHVERCETCQGELAAFRRAGRTLSATADELPASLKWDRLAAEMTANIRLGLAAGECVGGSVSPDAETEPAAASPRSWYSGWRLDWTRMNPLEWGDAARAAAAVGCLLFVSGGLWIWRGPAGQLLPARPSQETIAAANPNAETVLKTTLGGIGVERDGRALALTHEGRAVPAMTVSLTGSMNARYVDEDTGQVTIHNVYAE